MKKNVHSIVGHNIYNRERERGGGGGGERDQINMHRGDVSLPHYLGQISKYNKKFHLKLHSL